MPEGSSSAAPVTRPGPILKVTWADTQGVFGSEIERFARPHVLNDALCDRRGVCRLPDVAKLVRRLIVYVHVRFS